MEKSWMTQDWYDAYYSHIDAHGNLEGWNAAIAQVVRELRAREVQPARIVDLGCGRGALLRTLVHEGLFERHEVYGVEQSVVATQELARAGCHIVHTDLQCRLPFSEDMFSYVIVAEVIEHLLRPISFLREIVRILVPGGYLILSFPNYINVPWLALRLAAEWFNKPQMIILQPIDRILFYPQLKGMVISQGLHFVSARGTFYFPPLPRGATLEPRWFTQLADHLGLQSLSFHPVLVFQKPALSTSR
jgi:2-polyprenyl-3-methyl-5-hydroxy-6-metoxy-1,4-benzoquinol methylase